MKALKHMIFAIMILAASCEISLPRYPAGNEGVTEGLGGGRKPPALKEYPAFVLVPLENDISDDFIRGVDISNCYIIEQAGGVYYDFDNNQRDIIGILREQGVNWVRLRLWHNHKLAANPFPYNGDGDNDLVKTKAIARRARAAGMKFLLDFHYSDNWADPGRQQIPAAWADYTADQLVNAVYEYTLDTILELKAAGAEPDMVQLGNEITPGLLSPVIGSNWADVARALNAGARAVRLVAPDAKIVLHLDRGGDQGAYQTWFDRFTVHSGQAATIEEVDYDVVGLSWYPYYSSHQSLDDLYSNIRNIRSRFNKDAVVVETGWAWTIEYDGDELSNLFHITQENQTAVQMTNANGFLTNSEIVFATRGDGVTKYLPASTDNQARVLRAVFDAVVSAGGGGIFWWAADWIPCTGLRSNWDNQTLFDFDGKALPALAVMGVNLAREAPPSRPGNFRAGSIGIDSVTLTWARNSSAAGYHIEKAAAETGPWTEIFSGAIIANPPAYTDSGLTPATGYYYRVMAYNAWGSGDFSSPLHVTTGVLAAPGGFGIAGITPDTVTLRWNSLAGITCYEIYHAGGTAGTGPDETEYALLTSPAAGDTDYTHEGLHTGETHWYRIRAVYGTYGEGEWSTAIEAEAGTEPVHTASINMATGTLDADFTDPLKAASSTDSRNPSISGSNLVIQGLYAANDAANLYVALDFGSVQPAGYNFDRLVIWIDNTGVSVGGANLTSMRIAEDQTVTNGSIEAVAYMQMNQWSGGAAGTSGASVNVTTWAGGNASPWTWKPTVPAGATVVKFSIPLTNIGGAVKGDELRILAAFSQGWSTGPTFDKAVVGDIIPSAAAAVTGADNDSVTINMGNALSYIVK